MNIWSLWSSTWNPSGNPQVKSGSDYQDSHLARCFVPAEKWPTLQRGVHESLHLILPEASTILLPICGFYFSRPVSNMIDCPSVVHLPTSVDTKKALRSLFFPKPKR